MVERGRNKIGKYVIENLTEGMYLESYIIFREYIQNATDQIDKINSENLFLEEDLEPLIDIEIDPENRKIVIYDNATGIPKSEVAKKLGNIADSDKEFGKDKGFRGIGRLGGLAYCETLRFTTSFKGESQKTIMSWDAKKLSEIINNKDNRERAEEILEEIINYEFEDCDENEHFFQVELIRIKKENKDLLDIKGVRKYIAENAPLPYSNKFIFSPKIDEFLKEHNLSKNEYKIYVNGEEQFKNYTLYLKEKIKGTVKQYDEIFDIEIEELRNNKNELLAWMWYGLCRFDKAIPESVNEMKGIRLRQSNIQLGNELTLSKFFQESRGNSYFIGEIHAVHKELKPNGRRDYFNENNIREEFEEEVKKKFKNLHKFYNQANNLKNAYKKITLFEELEIDFREKIKNGKFINEEEVLKEKEKLKINEEEKKKAVATIERFSEQTPKETTIYKVKNKIEKKYLKENEELKERDSDILKETKIYKDPKIYLAQNLSKLDKKQQKLVTKIFSVIKREIADERVASELIKKIEEELR